jgi:hypothetical protein
MPYRIAGIDVHKRILAVVVSDVEIVDQGAAFYDLRHRELQIKRLKSKAEARIPSHPNTGGGLTIDSF